MRDLRRAHTPAQPICAMKSAFDARSRCHPMPQLARPRLVPGRPLPACHTTTFHISVFTGHHKSLPPNARHCHVESHCFCHFGGGLYSPVHFSPSSFNLYPFLILSLRSLQSSIARNNVGILTSMPKPKL